MKAFDRVLQYWRISKVRPYVQKGARLLDIGCADGALFRWLSSGIEDSVGIDPDLPATRSERGYQLIAGHFPRDLPAGPQFDVITMLAVLEHVPVQEQPALAARCMALLKPGGLLIMTVPSPVTDQVLSLLLALRVIDGMDLEQHFGYNPDDTPALFTAQGLQLVKRQKFQLGLNNLFVFRRP